ncbi:hypothetical protein [Methanosarcina vacuolata]|nr:hypothetical protein [Methanosarcina vacuolata]
MGKLLSAEDADAAEENKSKIKDIENNIFLWIVFLFSIKLTYNIQL